jgi:hypothetical protein
MKIFSLFFCLAGASLAQDSLVTIPSTAYGVTDGVTGVPVRITISEFRISKAEVTQAEYLAVAGVNPSYHRGDDLPVDSVTWWDAIRYCNQRSVREGLDPAYDLTTGAVDLTRNGYRLPTDAEWQAAAGKLPDPAAANLGSTNTKEIPVLLAELRERSPKPAGAYPANEFGLHNMMGNVWEWCQDYFDPVANTVHRAGDPAGPAAGLNRVLRGGSYISTTSRWNRGYRTSLPPESKSRFTGFRVARSTGRGFTAEPADFFEPYNRVPPAFAGQTGGLSPLTQDKAAWREKWSRILGRPRGAAPPPTVRVLATIEEPTYTGRLMMLQVEADAWEKIYLMIPREPSPRPRPVVITPYYDVDTVAGRNLAGRNYLPPSVRSFALQAVQQGFAAVAIRWFGESYGESYSEAVANLALRNPGCTGLGKWVWDAQRLIDYLETLPDIDRNAIGIIGQSLGGKMSLYAAAMDDRIKAAVSSEPGIGLSFSNYEDFWYLAERVRDLPPGTDQHELIGMIAPRAFLLIGGESADNDKSWHYINAARPVYERLGHPRRIGYFNHRQGHTPTPEAARLSMEWLARFLRRQ